MARNPLSVPVMLDTNSTYGVWKTSLRNNEVLHFEIRPREALVDEYGVIRVFLAHFDDGDVQMYKLLPIEQGFDPVPWITTFLGQFGVSLMRGQLHKRMPNGQDVAIQLATFFVTNQIINPIIKSVTNDLLGDNSCGYYNVLTDNLVFSYPLLHN